MKLFEFDKNDLGTAHYDPAEDKINSRDLSDTRKDELTLKMINRLKKLRAIKKLEALKREDLLSIMYAIPDGGGMGGF